MTLTPHHNQFWYASIIRPNTVPTMATPNAYAGTTGVKVHRTVWAWRAAKLVAYPACNAETQLVPPGRWTYDPVTCTRVCRHMSVFRAASASQDTHSVIRLRMQLWTEIINAVGGFGKEIFRIGGSSDPARRERSNRLIAISEDLRAAFLDQCVDDKTYRVLMTLVAEHRQTMFDILCEDLADGRVAARRE